MDHDPKIIRSPTNVFNQNGRFSEVEESKYKNEALLYADTYRGSSPNRNIEIRYKGQENNDHPLHRRISSNGIFTSHTPSTTKNNVPSLDVSFLKTDRPISSTKRNSMPNLNFARISNGFSPTTMRENISAQTIRDQFSRDGLTRLCKINGLNVPDSARRSKNDAFSKSDKKIDMIHSAKVKGNRMIRSNSVSPSQIIGLLKKKFIDEKMLTLPKYKKDDLEEIFEKNKELLNRIKLVKMLKLDKIAAEGGFPLKSVMNTLKKPNVLPIHKSNYVGKIKSVEDIFATKFEKRKFSTGLIISPAHLLQINQN